MTSITEGGCQCRPGDPLASCRGFLEASKDAHVNDYYDDDFIYCQECTKASGDYVLVADCPQRATLADIVAGAAEREKRPARPDDLDALARKRAAL